MQRQKTVSAYFTIKQSFCRCTAVKAWKGWSSHYQWQIFCMQCDIALFLIKNDTVYTDELFAKTLFKNWVTDFKTNERKVSFYFYSLQHSPTKFNCLYHLFYVTIYIFYCTLFICMYMCERKESN